VDRLAALLAGIDIVRRAGTLSISGVYGGMVDRWVDDLLPLVSDDADPLGVSDLATDRLPLDQAPDAYAAFQQKKEGTIKVVFQPSSR
jgi:threonine dehydrogenase-like Zn-dependent dehydrogenase